MTMITILKVASDLINQTICINCDTTIKFRSIGFGGIPSVQVGETEPINTIGQNGTFTYLNSTLQWAVIGVCEPEPEPEPLPPTGPCPECPGFTTSFITAYSLPPGCYEYKWGLPTCRTVIFNNVQ